MPTPFLPATPDRDSHPLLAEWRAMQQAIRSRPLQILALNFRVEPLRGPPSPPGGMFQIVWPEPNGEGRRVHNAHPDCTVMQTRAGDVLVSGRDRWRVRSVQIYRAFPVMDERTSPWCRSVEDAIRDASQ